jgi:hypothetical protein
MSNIIIESVIGPDGTLHLDVPIGIENANQPVRVVIEAARKPMTRAEWGALCGRWRGASPIRRSSGLRNCPLNAGAAVVTYLLDTNTCIGWLRRNQPQIGARIEAQAQTDIVLCSVVALKPARRLRLTVRPWSEERFQG